MLPDILVDTHLDYVHIPVKVLINGSNASSISASYGDLERVLFPEPPKYQTPILIVVY